MVCAVLFLVFFAHSWRGVGCGRLKGDKKLTKPPACTTMLPRQHEGNRALTGVADHSPRLGQVPEPPDAKSGQSRKPGRTGIHQGIQTRTIKGYESPLNEYTQNMAVMLPRKGPRYNPTNSGWRDLPNYVRIQVH